MMTQDEQLCQCANNIHTLKQRVDELETRLVFADDTIEALNEVLVKQDRLLLEMQDQLKQLYSRMQQIDPETGLEPFDPSQNVPPHY